MFTRKLRPEQQRRLSRAPSARFAIVGNPRTGSSHLASLLDSHPDVACWDDEILDAGEAFDRSRYDEPRQFLRERVFRVDADAVGFKLLWDAMTRFPDVWTLFKDLDLRLLHLVRSNRLDSFLSLQLALVNRSFTSWNGFYKDTRIESDYFQLREWFEVTDMRDELIQHRASEEGIVCLKIEYSELCVTQDRILRFLGVPLLPLASALKKQRKTKQRETLANYDELKQAFAGSPWADYFED